MNSVFEAQKKKHQELVPQLEKVLKAMKTEGLFEQYRERSGFTTLFAENVTSRYDHPG